MILIVGNKGNMGRRYSAILENFGYSYIGIDKGDPIPNRDFSGVIIATPTENHFDDIMTFGVGLKLPILCEKAITKDPKKLRDLLSLDINLAMVNQYEYVRESGGATDGQSWYNYWNTGKDGLVWDCINIIGLSETKPSLDNKSPLWSCAINGEVLNISRMDGSYCRMISNWIKRKNETKDYIEKAHKKVWDWFGGSL